jgi:translation initiation factor IF-1
MAREGAYKVEAKVVEILPSPLYRVELSNGHQLVAHVTGRQRQSVERLPLGEKVVIEMSPYDLSKGCII